MRTIPNNGSDAQPKNQPEERWKYAGMSDAQIQAEKAQEQKTLAIQAEMRKIERKAQEDSLSQYQKIKIQLKQEKKVPKIEYSEIADRMREIEAKNFTSNFTTCTRDQH